MSSASLAAAVVVSAAVAAGCWLWLLPRLPEPAGLDANHDSNAGDDDAPPDNREDSKVPYAELVTPVKTLVVTVCAAAAAATSWITVPVAYQPLWAVLAVLGVVLAAVDGFTTWIPAVVTRWAWAAMAAAGAAAAPLGAHWTDVARILGGALAAGAVYLVLWLVTRGGFGFGDVRFVPLVAAPCAALGWTALLLSLFIGSLLGVGHAVWRRLRGKLGVQPWAPTLLIGAYLTAVWAAVPGM